MRELLFAMRLTVNERVQAWQKRRSLKREAKYLAGEFDSAPKNGQASLSRKSWRLYYLRRKLARDAELDFPPIKTVK